MKDPDIYDPSYVRDLFDRISNTYGYTNYIASFGFTERWRKQCLEKLTALPNNAVGYDLMCGRGETWTNLFRKYTSIAHLGGLDISGVMINACELQRQSIGGEAISLYQEDVFCNSIPSQSADFIVSTFGIKTFTEQQLKKLAAEVNRILKPGGRCSFIEVSHPKGWIFESLYIFYLKRMMPIIEKLFLRYAYGYSMIGTYTVNFGDCTKFAEFLKLAGLKVEFKKYFFGCASGVSGFKPE